MQLSCHKRSFLWSRFYCDISNANIKLRRAADIVSKGKYVVPPSASMLYWATVTFKAPPHEPF